jgi:biopolymer transport protein TolQ
MDAAQSVVTPDNFSLISVFLRADWIVKGVLLLLAVASLGSWTVVIAKLFRFGALNTQANRFEREVASGRSLEDVASQVGEHPQSAMGRMLVAALREWREARLGGPLDDNGRAFLIQKIDRSLDSIIARESMRIEEGLSSLAIVATSSPFIGLFGTVWGIMHAFQSIALQKNTSLAVVAPSIAEALFTTAIGLLAAIPAYMFYNKFSTDAGKFAGRLEAFADDIAAAVTRRLGARG